MRRATRTTGRALESTVCCVLAAAAMVGGWIGAKQIDAKVLGRPKATAAVLAATAVSPAEAEAAPVAPPGPEGDELGKFRLSRYYMVSEDDHVVLASGGRGGVTIYDDRGCKPIATIGKRFAEVLDMQGSGRLRDGRTVNVSRSCRCAHSPCYRPMSEAARWGMSATSRPLEPFRTVAVDPRVIKLGSVLYIPELDGMTMPGRAPWGGFVHDGCVVASDRGGGIDGKHLDFFVGRFEYKKALDARRKMKSVTVYRGGARCGSGSARGGS